MIFPSIWVQHRSVEKIKCSNISLPLKWVFNWVCQLVIASKSITNNRKAGRKVFVPISIFIFSLFFESNGNHLKKLRQLWNRSANTWFLSGEKKKLNDRRIEEEKNCNREFSGLLLCHSLNSLSKQLSKCSRSHTIRAISRLRFFVCFVLPCALAVQTYSQQV